MSERERLEEFLTGLLLLALIFGPFWIARLLA